MQDFNRLFMTLRMVRTDPYAYLSNYMIIKN